MCLWAQFRQARSTHQYEMSVVAGTPPPSGSSVSGLRAVALAFREPPAERFSGLRLGFEGSLESPRAGFGGLLGEVELADDSAHRSRALFEVLCDAHVAVVDAADDLGQQLLGGE